MTERSQKSKRSFTEIRISSKHAANSPLLWKPTEWNRKHITEWLTVEKQLGVNGETLEGYKKACASSGIRGYWLQALEIDKKEVGHEAGSLSSYYARLGDRDQAFYWLDRAFDQRAPWLVYAKVTPVYDNLRNDPRFPAFLQRMRL